jgi:carbamoyl-phosphate synthase large subunit
LAKLAAKIMAGMTLEELGFTQEVEYPYYAVKEAVFPFLKFSGADVILGPEMLSTGEVMGLSDDFGMAYAKSQMAAGNSLPTRGTVFISVRDSDKPKAVLVGKKLHELGFKIIATGGTCIELIKNNVPSEFVRKVVEGRPNITDRIINGQVELIINTTVGEQTLKDSFVIRRTALDRAIPYATTIRGAAAMAKAIEALQKSKVDVKAIQLYYR